jgi:hypothetical protein
MDKTEILKLLEEWRSTGIRSMRIIFGGWLRAGCGKDALLKLPKTQEYFDLLRRTKKALKENKLIRLASYKWRIEFDKSGERNDIKRVRDLENGNVLSIMKSRDKENHMELFFDGHGTNIIRLDREQSKFLAMALWEHWRKEQDKRTISFRPDMIGLILRGEKVVTIRPVKPEDAAMDASSKSCRYGKPGDLVIVREQPDIVMRIEYVRPVRLHDINPWTWFRDGLAEANARNRVDIICHWNSFYGKTEYRWASNPLVWVIWLEVVSKEADNVQDGN